MLTDKEKNEITEEVKISPFPAVACLDALKIVQQHKGWISDESIKDIAEFLDISAEQVEGVASYYSRIYRTPVGRHVILLCDSISCMIMGYDSLYDQLSKKLGIVYGETTPDKRFTLLPISCLGDCDHAPSMMIDNELYSTIKPESIELLLEKYK